MSLGAYDQYEILGYDVVSESGAIIAGLVDRTAAEQIQAAQGGTIIAVPRAFVHRAAYVARQSSN
jgi:hypothetical protein